jgi:spermidine synthase
MQENIVFKLRTEFQEIVVTDNPLFGKMLYLDNDLQIAEKDADLYNEGLVSPLADFIPDQSVLILGGGSGGCISEVLKHGPKSIVFIDIDKELIRASRKYLPQIHKNSFDSTLVSYIEHEALVYLKNDPAKYRCIVYSLTSFPERLGSGESEKFYESIVEECKQHLAPCGAITLQCCDMHNNAKLSFIKNVLKCNFNNLSYKNIFIPSFGTEWVFAFGETSS